MTEINITWSMENIWDFVKYTIITKTKQQKFFFLAIIICFAFILTSSIISAVTTQNTFMILLSVIVFAIAAGYFIIYYFIMKNYAKKIYNANKNSPETSIVLTDDNIVICQERQPVGVIGWNDIKDISNNVKKATYYLTTEQNALLLLEEKNIVTGDKFSLMKIIEDKKNELERSKDSGSQNN